MVSLIEFGVRLFPLPGSCGPVLGSVPPPPAVTCPPSLPYYRACHIHQVLIQCVRLPTTFYTTPYTALLHTLYPHSLLFIPHLPCRPDSSTYILVAPHTAKQLPLDRFAAPAIRGAPHNACRLHGCYTCGPRALLVLTPACLLCATKRAVAAVLNDALHIRFKRGRALPRNVRGLPRYLLRLFYRFRWRTAFTARSSAFPPSSTTTVLCLWSRLHLRVYRCNT